LFYLISIVCSFDLIWSFCLFCNSHHLAHVLCDVHVMEAKDAMQCPVCADPFETADLQQVTVKATKRERLTLVIT
jgi:transcription elongation factor Elf1